MRAWIWLLAAAIVVAGGVSLYMLRPVQGAARDLTLAGDVARGQYLLRLGDCITCHTDKKNGVAELGGGPGLVTPFGTFYSPYINPDPNAGIVGFSLAMTWMQDSVSS